MRIRPSRARRKLATARSKSEARQRPWLSRPPRQSAAADAAAKAAGDTAAAADEAAAGALAERKAAEKRLADASAALGRCRRGRRGEEDGRRKCGGAVRDRGARGQGRRRGARGGEDSPRGRHSLPRRWPRRGAGQDRPRQRPPTKVPSRPQPPRRPPMPLQRRRRRTPGRQPIWRRRAGPSPATRRRPRLPRATLRRRPPPIGRLPSRHLPRRPPLPTMRRRRPRPPRKRRRQRPKRQMPRWRPRMRPRRAAGAVPAVKPSQLPAKAAEASAGTDRCGARRGPGFAGRDAAAGRAAGAAKTPPPVKAPRGGAGGPMILVPRQPIQDELPAVRPRLGYAGFFDRNQSSTKSRIAEDRFTSAGRARSISTTRPARLVLFSAAISPSACQNGSSSEMLVRWPAMVIERLAIRAPMRSGLVGLAAVRVDLRVSQDAPRRRTSAFPTSCGRRRRDWLRLHARDRREPSPCGRGGD